VSRLHSQRGQRTRVLDMLGIEVVTVSESHRIETVSFWATPVEASHPCLCRAVYDVLQENGHWIHRLCPGTLEIFPNIRRPGNGER
jgi:hypothetical protein